MQYFIDARRYHEPERAGELVTQAANTMPSQRELADRLGVTRKTLEGLKAKRTNLSYPMQLALEAVIAESDQELPQGRFLIQAARWFATGAHWAIKQRRKYVGTPYIEHPRAVAERVARTPDATPEMVAAAWLHDVIEDTHISADDLAREFPLPVINLVLAVTSPERAEAASSEEHHQAVLGHYADVPAAAQTITCADILDNCKTVVERCGAEALTFLERKRDILALLTEADPAIHEEASRLVTTQLAAAEALTKKSKA